MTLFFTKHKENSSGYRTVKNDVNHYNDTDGEVMNDHLEGNNLAVIGVNGGLFNINPLDPKQLSEGVKKRKMFDDQKLSII